MDIMKSEKPQTHSGKWFIPGKEIRLPGILTIDKINFKQYLQLYSKVDFEGIPIHPGSFKQINYPTICGEIGSNDKITLNKCNFRRSTNIGDDIQEITIDITISFYGGIFSTQNETKIIQLTCSFPYLSSWFDTHKLFFGVHYSTDDLMTKMKPALSQDDLWYEIKVDDDLTILIERQYQDNAFLFEKDISIKIKHYVHFRSSTLKTLREFLEFADQFMQLMKLSTGKLMYVNLISAIAKKNDLDDFSKKWVTRSGDVHLSIYNYSSFHRRKLVTTDYINTCNMLFYGGQDQTEKLKQIIINWYKTYKKYSPVYNIYLDTIEWFQNTEAGLSQIMFNNRFVNLVQALESYHYISYPNNKDEDRTVIKSQAEELLKEITNPENKNWLLKRIEPCHNTLRERLRDLMEDKLQIITDEIFQNKNEKKGFRERIKKIRDDLSHGNSIEMDVSKISDYYYKTLIILVSCILLNLGFSQIEIKKTLFRTLKYGNMISYMKVNMKKLPE